VNGPVQIGSVWEDITPAHAQRCRELGVPRRRLEIIGLDFEPRRTIAVARNTLTHAYSRIRLERFRPAAREFRLVSSDELAATAPAKVAS